MKHKEFIIKYRDFFIIIGISVFIMLFLFLTSLDHNKKEIEKFPIEKPVVDVESDF